VRIVGEEGRDLVGGGAGVAAPVAVQGFVEGPRPVLGAGRAGRAGERAESLDRRDEGHAEGSSRRWRRTRSVSEGGVQTLDGKALGNFRPGRAKAFERPRKKGASRLPQSLSVNAARERHPALRTFEERAPAAGVAAGLADLPRPGALAAAGWP